MGADDIKCRIMEEELKEFWPEWHVVKRLGGGSYGDVFQIFKDNFGIRVYAALKVIQINNYLAEETVPLSDPELIQGKNVQYDWQKNDMPNGQYRGNTIPEVFMNEIRIMEALRGAPNIVSIDDFNFRKGSDASTLYVRMELLTSFEEVMLTRRKNNNPFTIAEILKVGRDVCTALMYCEQRGIIHRDIKPANLFVDAYGNYKVGDFGVSKRMETVHAAHTMTGIGTISYMAPEIFAGHSYNNTVDIYALGMVLYQLLNNGRIPFLPAHGTYTARDFDNANYKRLRGEEVPSLTGLHAGSEIIDEQLNGIVCKACIADSHGRYRTAKELFDALTDYMIWKKNIGNSNAEVKAHQGKNSAGKEKSSEIKHDRTVRYGANSPAQKKPLSMRARIGIIIAVWIALIILLGGGNIINQLFHSSSANSTTDIVESETAEEIDPTLSDDETSMAENETVEETNQTLSDDETSMAENETVEETNQTLSDDETNMVENEMADGTGTVSAEDYIRVAGSSGRAITDDVMIRNDASTEARIIGSINEGDEIIILDALQNYDGYVWYYIELENGNRGYVRSDLIDADISVRE